MPWRRPIRLTFEEALLRDLDVAVDLGGHPEASPAPLEEVTA
jgi:hypothetical protein